MEKQCYRCKKTLPVADFSKDKFRKDGLSGACKPCDRTRRAAHASQNREAETTRRLAWARANPERDVEIKAKHRANLSPEQIEAHRAICRQYKKENPAVVRKNDSAYRAAKGKAVTKWDVELTDFAHAEAFHLAVLREQILGSQWEVDHIVPLRGKKVCGLHVWNNFQVITRLANRKKRNKFVVE